MRLQRESCVYFVYLCREIVANYSRTSPQLSHSSEIGAEGHSQVKFGIWESSIKDEQVEVVMIDGN